MVPSFSTTCSYLQEKSKSNAEFFFNLSILNTDCIIKIENIMMKW